MIGCGMITIRTKVQSKEINEEEKAHNYTGPSSKQKEGNVENHSGP